MSTTNTNTIVALKSAFLKAQIRTLLQPLQVPEQWGGDDRDLPLGMVEDVLRQVNRLVRQHVKAAYSSLAVRHVAEQIDKLYWNAAEPLLQEDEAIDDIPRHDADLTLDETISQLPLSWAIPDIPVSSNRRETQLEAFAEQSSYSASLSRLRSLADRRAALRTRLDRLKNLNQMLQPFQEPQKILQPNIVVRDGELAKEMERMRALSARLVGKLGEGQRASVHAVVQDGRARKEPDPDWVEPEKWLEEILRMG